MIMIIKYFFVYLVYLWQKFIELLIFIAIVDSDSTWQ